MLSLCCVHKSWSQCSKRSAGRVGQGWVDSKGGRKQVVGIRAEGMYVWMEVRRYVCIMSQLQGKVEFAVAGLTHFNALQRRARERAMSLVACLLLLLLAPCSSFLAPC